LEITAFVSLVSILTIRCWVAYVAYENYPHFIWVLVVSGFAAGTGLEGLKPTHQTKVFSHHWGGRPHPVGVKPCQSPGKLNTVLKLHLKVLRSLADIILYYMTMSSRLKECWCWRLLLTMLAVSEVL